MKEEKKRGRDTPESRQEDRDFLNDEAGPVRNLGLEAAETEGYSVPPKGLGRN